MLEENATVIAVHDNRIEVETIARSSCSQCSSTGCSTSVLSKLFGVKRNRLTMQNTRPETRQLIVGSQVVIGIPDSVLVRASLWAYFVPVLSMIVTTLIATLIGLNDIQQALCGMIGLLIGLMISNQINQKEHRRKDFDPIFIRSLESAPSVQPIVNFNSEEIKEV